jgi:hypothetical protein
MLTHDANSPWYFIFRVLNLFDLASRAPAPESAIRKFLSANYDPRISIYDFSIPDLIKFVVVHSSLIVGQRRTTNSQRRIMKQLKTTRERRRIAPTPPDDLNFPPST